MTDPNTLYEQILRAWNARDAAAFASCFQDDGSIVGFDGSQADTRVAIEQHLRPIFAGHRTASYVAIVREVRMLSRDVAIVRAVAGMVPPNGDDINPKVNTIQTLVAVRSGESWRASMFQSTPAAWHGRPGDSAALTGELRGVLKRGVVVES
jgi:uncharacterized protein (TIGR02246 family)